MALTALLVAACLQVPSTTQDADPAPKVRVVRKATPAGDAKSAVKDEAGRPRSEPKIPAVVPGPAPKGTVLRSRFVANLSIPRPRPRAQSIPSYRVVIRMKNGRRFSGLVIRDRAFHHLVYLGEHHKDSIYFSEDRFKLSYVDGLDGDLLLSWWQMNKLEVREVLDDAGLLAFEMAQFEARVTRREEILRSQQELAMLRESSDETGESTGNTEEVQELVESMDDESVVDLPPLLAQFSPMEGWGEERKRQIEWRRTVVGVFPTEEEEEFLDKFDEWQIQFEQWSKDEEALRNAEDEKLQAKKAEVLELQKKLEEADRKRGRTLKPSKGTQPPTKEADGDQKPGPGEKAADGKKD